MLPAHIKFVMRAALFKFGIQAVCNVRGCFLRAAFAFHNVPFTALTMALVVVVTKNILTILQKF